jgi:phage terminase large subunit
VQQKVQVPDKLLPLFWPARYKVAYSGRGAGKSWSFARALLTLGAERPLSVVCAREIQNSIADSVHKLLVEQIAELNLGHVYEVQSAAIIGSNGTEFTFKGLRQQDVGKIKSLEGCDICWVEEAQSVSEASWQILTPTIRKAGSEIWVSFNPDMEDDPVWQRFVVSPPIGTILMPVSWRDNPWFTEELEMERQDTLYRNREVYRNIWEGECRSIASGAIFANELLAARTEGRICNVPHDPVLPVHTFWDLGIGDFTAIWAAQQIGSEIRVINYHADEGEGLPYYANVLKREWGYNYGKHWAPHDIQVREFGSGRSRIETARQLGIIFQMVPRAGSGNAEALEERIHASRMVFGRCWFDAKNTAAGIKALSNYRRAFNTALDEFKPTPVHDWASHGADAFGHMAVSLRTEPERKPYIAPASRGAGGWMS